MPRFSITRQNAEGQGIPELDIDLYEGDGSGSKVGDFVDALNGNYYIDYSNSGEYTVKINGAIVTIFQNIYLPSNDQLLKEHADDETIEYVDTGGGVYKLRIKDAGVKKEKINADVAGDGLKQNVDKSLSPDVDGATIEIDPVTKKQKVKDDVFASQSAINEINTKIGDLDFESTAFLSQISGITNSLRVLDSTLKSLAVDVASINNLEATEHHQVLTFHWKHNTDPTGLMIHDSLQAEIYMPKSGIIKRLLGLMESYGTASKIENYSFNEGDTIGLKCVSEGPPTNLWRIYLWRNGAQISDYYISSSTWTYTISGQQYKASLLVEI